MPIFKHTEFKAVCEVCMEDLTDYIHAETKREAIRKFKALGVIKTGRVYLCDSCREANKEDRETRRPAHISPDVFANAKTIDVWQMLIGKDNQSL